MDWHDLIGRLRERDLAARHEIYEGYHERVFFVLSRHFPNATAHHADCIQDGMIDAFLEFFDRPESFDPARSRARDPLLAYLIGVASRRTIDHLRRLNPDALNYLQDEVEEEDDPPDEALFRRPDRGPAPERSLDEVIVDLEDGRMTIGEFTEYVMLQAESSVMIERLDQLNGRQREVLFLKYVAEFSTKDIMQFLNLTEDAVENVLRRARDVLRGGRR